MALAMDMVAIPVMAAGVVLAMVAIQAPMVLLAMVAIQAPMVLLLMLPRRLHPHNQQHRVLASNPARNPDELAQGGVGSSLVNGS
jgi:hypothetical protein